MEKRSAVFALGPIAIIAALAAFLLIFGCPNQPAKQAANGTIMPECSNSTECEVMGCNHEICAKAGANISSVCAWKDEFRCYRYTTCECGNGTCGWKMATEIEKCIEDARHPDLGCPQVLRLNRDETASCENEGGHVVVDKNESSGCEIAERCVIEYELACSWNESQCPSGYVCELPSGERNGTCKKLDYVKEAPGAMPTCKRDTKMQCAVGRVCDVTQEDKVARCFLLPNETSWYSYCGALSYLKCPDDYECMEEGDYPFAAVGCRKLNFTFCGGIVGLPCQDGFECKPDGIYPDAGGVCVPATSAGALTKCQIGSETNAARCVNVYLPVCAKVKQGAGLYWQEYANACKACAANASSNVVLGYNPGSC